MQGETGDSSAKHLLHQARVEPDSLGTRGHLGATGSQEVEGLGVKEVLLPKRNEKAVKEDLPENVKADIKIHLVSSIEEVLELALQPGDNFEVARERDRWHLRLSN